MLWILATIAAYFIKGLCGFANTLVFTTILSFGTANASISPIDLVLGYPTNLILTWKNRNRLDWKVWLPLSVLVLMGSVPGALLLKNADVRSIKLIFGLVVTALGTEMLLKKDGGQRRSAPKLLLALIGVAAGVLCGLFGVGALLAAYVSRVTDSGDAFKANISAVFIVDNTFRLILYSFLGLLTLDTVKLSLLLLPLGLVSLLLGIWCSRHMKEAPARKATAALLVLSGLSLILKNLF